MKSSKGLDFPGVENLFYVLSSLVELGPPPDLFAYLRPDWVTNSTVDAVLSLSFLGFKKLANRLRVVFVLKPLDSSRVLNISGQLLLDRKRQSRPATCGAGTGHRPVCYRMLVLLGWSRPRMNVRAKRFCGTYFVFGPARSLWCG